MKMLCVNQQQGQLKKILGANSDGLYMYVYEQAIKS